MSAKLLTATALVSGTLLLYGGAAYAAPFMSATPSLDRDVQLVRSGGGGGGGANVGGGGGGAGGVGHVGGGGGGGGAAHVGGGGSYGGRISSGGHLSSGHFSSGRSIARADVATRGRIHADVATRGRIHNGGDFAEPRSINRDTIARRDDDRSGRRHAEHDWDHDWNHNDWRHHRNRFSSVYVYTPWLYSNADCGWLYQRAIATGSAYWWSRYDACVNY
jgi:hypothetical protein